MQWDESEKFMISGVEEGFEREREREREICERERERERYVRDGGGRHVILFFGTSLMNRV